MLPAQERVQLQFPNIDGWQSTLLVQNDGFILARREAIQIYVINDSHWVTSSSLDSKVTVYECRKVHGPNVFYINSPALSSTQNVHQSDGRTKAQLTVNIPNVLKQRGSRRFTCCIGFLY